jgi:methionine--tRNA ligase beta chain
MSNYDEDAKNESEKEVSIEDFLRIHLRVGKVTKAESISGTKKILRVNVDIGTEEREIAVGAAPYYKPEELIGKIVVVCTNLQPRKIGSIKSNGMLLAANGYKGKPVFLTINEEAPLGADIH